MNRTVASTPAGSRFVAGMAWISIALGVLGAVSGLLQAAMLPALPVDAMMQSLAGAEMSLPPALAWLFSHLQLLNLLSLLSSALFAWVSWGLLQRCEWGRRGFIAFLALGALAGIVAAAWFGRVLDGMGGSTDYAGDIDPLLAQLQAAMRATLWVAAAAVALLHGAIVWKLCTPAIRAEFVHDSPAP